MENVADQVRGGRELCPLGLRLSVLAGSRCAAKSIQSVLESLAMVVREPVADIRRITQCSDADFLFSRIVSFYPDLPKIF